VIHKGNAGETNLGTGCADYSAVRRVSGGGRPSNCGAMRIPRCADAGNHGAEFFCLRAVLYPYEADTMEGNILLQGVSAWTDQLYSDPERDKAVS
jgi:hypothetical protein